VGAQQWVLQQRVLQHRAGGMLRAQSVLSHLLGHGTCVMEVHDDVDDNDEDEDSCSELGTAACEAWRVMVSRLTIVRQLQSAPLSRSL
jgi:hypothetical protein